MTARDPTAVTVAQAFDVATRRFADHDFVHLLAETAAAFGRAPKIWTYAEAAMEVARLRTVYQRAGYGHGHRAGIMLSNRPEFLFHFLALNGLGVSVVPINADWRSAELQFLIEHSEISVAVCLDRQRAAIGSAAAAVGRVVETWTGSEEEVGAARTAPPDSARAADENTECALLYTSGTTGRPKGCVLSNEYFLHSGRWYLGIGGLCPVRPGEERMLSPLPLTHMNALAVSTMCMITSGGCLTLLDRFHPRTWWDSVRESRATIVHYLGVMPAMLLGAPSAASDRAHSVRFGFGAGVNPRHHAIFEERFGFPLIEAWAMTETGSGAVVIANHEPRHVGTACFGVAASDVECRVVGDDGADVAPGLPGELLVRHAGTNPRYGFFSHYLKDPEATAQAWVDGWFHTGDLVTRDGAGNFRFVDRKKNVIRRSGENISAVEVESVLAQHPATRSVGVTAVPDEIRGDEVFACIVLRDGALPNEALARDLAAYCLERLAYYKAPGYVAFCEALPLTATAKIQRAGLKELAATCLAGPDRFDVRGMKRQERH